MDDISGSGMLGRTSPPVVSVVIATYNWSSVLRHAIESVLWQTFSDFELIVVGDGCTDDSEETVASFGDQRVRWHNLAENSGHQSAPNNAGIEMSRGKYIAYLGHDDIWHPCHLAVLVEKLETEQAQIGHTLGVMIGPEGSNARILTGLWPDDEFRPGVYFPPSTMMHTASLVREIGSWADYRSLSIHPEVDLQVRAFDAGARFARVDRLTVFKFNSAWRRNCYLEKPCHEQAEYLRRIREEPDFVEREWLAITRVLVLGLPADVPTVRDRPDAPPGWRVGQYRRQRGLEAGPVDLLSAAERQTAALAAENEVLRVACEERLAGLRQLTTELLSATKENELLRTACEERLRLIHKLSGENEALREASAQPRPRRPGGLWPGGWWSARRS